MRKGRIKYYFKNKNAVINDVGKLCDMNEQLEQELDKYKNRIDKTIEYLEYQISQLDFEKDIKAKMLGAMVLVLLQGSDE